MRNETNQTPAFEKVELEKKLFNIISDFENRTGSV
jgi:hypothetical protein